MKVPLVQNTKQTFLVKCQQELLAMYMDNININYVALDYLKK